MASRECRKHGLIKGLCCLQDSSREVVMEKVVEEIRLYYVYCINPFWAAVETVVCDYQGSTKAEPSAGARERKTREQEE